MDVALATCAVLPEPDPDAEPLGAALDAAGVSWGLHAWDDPAALVALEVKPPTLVVLRSTWNYPHDPEGFAAWAARAAAASNLWNPLPMVHWNLHKGYLTELAAGGLAITPTELVPRGSDRPLQAVLDARGWQQAVVKPAVGAGSVATLKVAADEGGDEGGGSSLRDGEQHLREHVARGDMLVQQYLPSVEGHGERALVWVDGALCHAVRKTPRFQGDDELVSTEAVPISVAEAQLAEQAVAWVTERFGEPLYARIDMAPGIEGAPVLMELELLEPSLFFAQGAEALQRFVSGIRRRLGRA